MSTLDLIYLPEDFLKKFNVGQRKILNILADNPSGIISRDLARMSGVSNKSETINKPFVREALAKEGLVLDIKRLAERGQWLWALRRIKQGEHNATHVDSVSFS